MKRGGERHTDREKEIDMGEEIKYDTQTDIKIEMEEFHEIV